MAFPYTRPTSGGAVLARVMIGDVAVRNVTFLAEAGGGYLGAAGCFLQAETGAYIAGFTLKGGYLLSAFGSGHSLLLSAGYTVSW